jgi:hypothetical protein
VSQTLDLLLRVSKYIASKEDLQNFSKMTEGKQLSLDVIKEIVRLQGLTTAEDTTLIDVVHKILGFGANEARWPPGVPDYAALYVYVTQLEGRLKKALVRMTLYRKMAYRRAGKTFPEGILE